VLKNNKIYVFDSTLRDGSQARGITFSPADRIHLVEILDQLGVDYIEAGNPASNPKEALFFEEVKNLNLNTSKIVAFGSTRRKNCSALSDSGIKSLLDANTPAVAIFGKCWDLHVTDVLGATLEENILMVSETIAYFKSKDKEVIFDAEHFFDGYKANPEYAMSVLEAAYKGGADSLALCDTNGGCMPFEVEKMTKRVVDTFDVTIGIHCHNDCGLAVANSVMAVNVGARQVQGTIIGFGERCGNACLTSLIGDLQLKMGFDCIPENNLTDITTIAHKVAELANITLDEKLPYVGFDAFAHKGGMHIDGVSKIKSSFEHINPSQVGNHREFLLSEVAGRSALVNKLQAQYPLLTRNAKETQDLMQQLKVLEHEGYHFEGAESSFELIVKRYLEKYKPFFKLEHFKIIDESSGSEGGLTSYTVVKINVNGQLKVSAAEGNGPVNALDKALRGALQEFYPQLLSIHLVDYKVRVLDTTSATAAKVRVIIETTDGINSWSTVGVSTDLIEASLIALQDAIEYKLACI
jgi:2-isopropylmalate synthase